MEVLHNKEEIIAQRYRIEKAIGQGSSGITYQATDIQNGQLVAVKALSLHRVSDWKTIEMFEREARVLSSLNHPGIPSYIDYFHVDTDTDRYFYIVQQLAQGQSLAALVEKGWHPTEKEVLYIAKQILEILVYLHSIEPPVIHRDIKPQNIILQPNTATNFVENKKATGCLGDIFLVDFGAVQNAYYNTFMRGSTVVGTYGYMAPEQFLGQAVPATDLYGLGATLLFLLTHRSPADLPTDKLKIDFRSRIQVSEEFADWLEKMLQPDLDDRFQSAKEALEVRRDKPMLIMRSNPSTRWKTFVKLGIAAVAAALVLNHFKYPILSSMGFTPIAVKEAVQQGDVETVRYYLDRGVNAKGKISFWNLLHFAGSKQVAELLISRGVNVNGKAIYGWTPLHIASMFDRLEVAERLIAAGADVNPKASISREFFTLADELLQESKNAKNNISASERNEFRKSIRRIGYPKSGFTPLHLARSTEMVKLLVSKGADINAKMEDGKTPLHTASSKQVIKQLLASGAWIDIKEENARNNKGKTLLHRAAEIGYKEMVHLLINKGVNVVVRDENGRTPLHYASTKEVANLLMVDINARDRYGNTPLKLALRNKQKEVATLLISKGADINAKDEYGQTFLHIAVENNGKEVAALLIAKGANVNATDSYYGSTPLHNAVANGNKEVAALLIAKSANVNAGDKYGSTPLHHAASKQNKEVAALLIAKGANVNARNKDGRTPLHHAALNQNKEVAALLIAKGANVNATDSYGRTPLHNAVENGNKEVVHMLIAKSADVNAKNDYGSTPLDTVEMSWLSNKEDKEEIKKLLIAHGAKK